jgi:hypothetical protein
LLKIGESPKYETKYRLILGKSLGPAEKNRKGLTIPHVKFRAKLRFGIKNLFSSCKFILWSSRFAFRFALTAKFISPHKNIEALLPLFFPVKHPRIRFLENLFDDRQSDKYASRIVQEVHD